MPDSRIEPALDAYNRAMSDGANGEDIIRRVLEAADAVAPTMTDRLQAVTAELIAALDWHKDGPALTVTAERVAVRLLAAHDRAALSQVEGLAKRLLDRSSDEGTTEDFWRDLKQAAAALSVLKERCAELTEALDLLVNDVENKWGDPHTLRHARRLLAREEGK